MTEIELLEAVLENLKAGKRADYNLLYMGCASCAGKAAEIDWDEAESYTRAPRTRVINGFVVPEPLAEVPCGQARVWIEAADEEDFADTLTWFGDARQTVAFMRGLLHATKEAAAANCKARLGIDPKWGGE